MVIVSIVCKLVIGGGQGARTVMVDGVLGFSTDKCGGIGVNIVMGGAPCVITYSSSI